MKAAAIVAMSILAAVTYGVLHDQITARICVEYFTVGHVDVGLTDPTALGLFWGVFATWWAGLLLGVPLAFAARAGSRPAVEPRSLARPIALLLLAMAASAVVAGGTGYVAALRGWVGLVPELASRLPPERHVSFVVDLWAHSASYLVGFVGGIWLAFRTWRRRAAFR